MNVIGQYLRILFSFSSQSLYGFITFSVYSSLRWSLGAIMYEMLVGYPPFYSDEPMSTCRKVRTGICSLGLLKSL